MITEVFNRYEQKYMISDEVYKQIKPQLEEYMEVDEHSRNGSLYTICNIYYDTPDSKIIRRSIEKPAYKEKLRLRSYGVVKPSDMVFLEIKKKFKGCVYKRRICLTLDEAYRYMETGQKPEAYNRINEQILNEIDYMTQRYEGLQPAVFLSYDRNAMYGIEDKSFRVTFDTNIRTRRYDILLDKGIYGELLLPNDMWIMEVKTRFAIPLWFAEMLSRYKLYPFSFSKYGTEYIKTLTDGNSRTSHEYLMKDA